MNKEEILAMKAGESLDALVAKEVMGWGIRISDGELDWARTWLGERDWASKGQAVCTDGPFADQQCPPFSTAISAAWLVVEKMSQLGHAMSLLLQHYEPHKPYWYCDFRLKGKVMPPEYEWVDHQPSAPEAICRAALLAQAALQSK